MRMWVGTTATAISIIQNLLHRQTHTLFKCATIFLHFVVIAQHLKPGRAHNNRQNRNCDFVCISISAAITSVWLLVLSAAIQIHNTLIGTSAVVRATWSTWCTVWCARSSWTDVNIAQWYQLLINRLAFCRLIYKFVSIGIVRIEGRSCKIPQKLHDWLEFKYARRRVNPRRRRLWKTIKSRSTSSRENRGHVALATQMDERAAVHYISMSSRFDKIRDWLPFNPFKWLTFYRPNDITAINFDCCS